LSSKLVLDYVSNVTMREFKNGVLMLTIKAPGVTFTNVQMWAIEYLLINKHGLENNRPLIITFETVTITGLTSFFGNDEVLAKFNLEVVTQFNNAEKVIQLILRKIGLREEVLFTSTQPTSLLMSVQLF